MGAIVHVENVDIRDMLQDIAIEEFSHLEMVGKLTAQHTSELDQTSLHDTPLLNLKGGGPHFLDSQGSCWTAAYIQEGGNIVRDLRANKSAEAGARQTYESLIKARDDEGAKKTLHHLVTRAHPRQYIHEGAGDAMGKLDDPFFGNISPDKTVKLVFSVSQDEDVRGPFPRSTLTTKTIKTIKPAYQPRKEGCWRSGAYRLAGRPRLREVVLHPAF